MGIRLTGLSTPVIGAEWEYIDKKNTVKETAPSLRIKSNHKIKVFISSQHGDNGKYDCVRSQLKKTIEETGLADAIKLLEGALTQAKDEPKPDWVIQDILIDLRNLHWVSNTEHNCFVESEAQKELNEFEEELYYPSLDRIHNSLQGK